MNAACPPPLSGNALLQRFIELDAFLLQHQRLWQPKPFTELELPWEAEHPALAHWLRQRTLEQADGCHNQPDTLDAPAPYPQLAAQAVRLAELPALPTCAVEGFEHRLSVDVPGRKWQQIEAFARCLPKAPPVGAWLDWCAGKGHLGRLLANAGGDLVSLEREPALVAEAQRLSDRLGISAQHRQQDVLADDVARHLQPQQTVVALHACGELHVQLMRQASAQGCQRMAIAPCCYNRMQGEHYAALSQAARGSSLILDQDALRLTLAETVTAGARVRRQRDTSMARRLAFDLLQRELRGVDEYLYVPSVGVDWLARPFADYCQGLAELRQLEITGAQDWGRLEARGWQRLAEVRNLELVRGLFRRPLELWLLLDRALYLDEQGYDVSLGAFCPSSLTPRNVLLLAQRR
ncbi:MAG: hypothetical protein GAK45_01595 [Pseudomonas citronellolis]|nr:MAG: hypothetical protein GAK45_01595 [Pseudomonas citronellolis]